ncbi:MAG: ABC transporter ATP-binding protein [Candidatus Dormibacteria bacterium]
MSGQPFLALSGVRAAYGSIEALKGIDLEVGTGELVALIGANGAGKSTTVRTISGLMRPTAGRIMFDGDDITLLGAEGCVRRGISLCPEGRRVFPRMSVHENLVMGAYTRRDKAEIASDLDRAYTLFPRLAERREQLAGTLSGGEQQMLAIGRALMPRPRLLLLDEPSLGLAPVLVETIFETLGEINRQGTTVLLIEQNALSALQLAHRGYVLETGRVVHSGPAASLLGSEDVRRAYLGV